jgi:hypothetical protein
MHRCYPGGNAGGTEVSMMILDHWLYTQNKTALVRYFPILAATLDFFSHHHKNRTADGEMVIWPTQALETYWCAWEPFFDAATNQSNCIVNDHPTVAALHVLCERALTQVPSDVSSAEQRAQWSEMQKILPAVPVTTENGFETVSPYGSYPINNALHNGETPELYSVHPFRYFSLGRKALGATRDFTPALNCLTHGRAIRATCGNANGNGGWNQGIMNAALLGDAKIASTQCVNRAKTPSGKGYRFEGFAPHEQDYEPSADQFANMNSALNWMLLQPADDGANGSSIAFGAWPCSWDVDFKLAAPLNTTVVRGVHPSRFLVCRLAHWSLTICFPGGSVQGREGGLADCHSREPRELGLGPGVPRPVKAAPRAAVAEARRAGAAGGAHHAAERRPASCVFYGRPRMYN